MGNGATWSSPLHKTPFQSDKKFSFLHVSFQVPMRYIEICE